MPDRKEKAREESLEKQNELKTLEGHQNKDITWTEINDLAQYRAKSRKLQKKLNEDILFSHTPKGRKTQD